MANKNDKNDKIKNNKPFLKDFKAELKKVTWPTWKQLVNNTIGVLAIVVIVAIIVFILDFAFDAMNKYGVNGLKGIVQEDEITVTENTDNDSEENNSEGANDSEDTTGEESKDSDETVNDVSEQGEEKTEEKANDESNTEETTNTENKESNE